MAEYYVELKLRVLVQADTKFEAWLQAKGAVMDSANEVEGVELVGPNTYSPFRVSESLPSRMARQRALEQAEGKEEQ